jgi:hypothetical protein
MRSSVNIEFVMRSKTRKVLTVSDSIFYPQGEFLKRYGQIKRHLIQRIEHI